MTFVHSLLAVLAGLLLATAVGYALARFFADGLSRPEKIAWSFAAGLFTQAFLFVLCVLIFVVMLQLRLPLFGPWLGG